EAEPAVPGTDVEHALACEIGRNRKPRPSLALPLERHAAFDASAVRKLEAVIPALARELLQEVVLLPPEFAQGRHHSITSSRSLASTCWPGCTRSCFTVPATGAYTVR